ncbi:MAG TPA: SH3 domain-containing protein, partial [Devosiaceae bacterium]|nr:SH3 domain-containing protein [Devosiaceae bacterium]
MTFRQLAVAALLAAGGLFAVAGSASAANNAISTAYVNARSCAGTGCGVLYVLPPNTAVEVISVSGNWCQTNRAGFPTAWISCSYLSALQGGGGGGAPAAEAPDVNFCFTGPAGNQICLGTGGV